MALIGEFQCRLVNHIHNKKFASRKVYKDVPEILDQFIKDVSQHQNYKETTAPKGWFEKGDGNAQASKDTTVAPSSVQMCYDDRGQLTVETLAKLGFVKDAILKGPDKNQWTVISIKSGHVHLHRTLQEETTAKVTCNELVDGYKVELAKTTVTNYSMKDHAVPTHKSFKI